MFLIFIIYSAGVQQVMITVMLAATAQPVKIAQKMVEVVRYVILRVQTLEKAVL